jgi:hypothetical protein
MALFPPSCHHRADAKRRVPVIPMIVSCIGLFFEIAGT